MPVAFSKDLRESIVNAYKNGVGTMAKVAKLFGVSERSVAKFYALDKDHGDLTPGKATGRPPLLNDSNLSIIKMIVLSHPSGRLIDYCERFEKKTGLVISKSCLWDACNILNLRRKKKVFMHKNKIAKISKTKGKVL